MTRCTVSLAGVGAGSYRQIRSGLTLVCLLLVPTIPAADDKPSRPEIGKRGKAATALLINGLSSASAFCIHPSGLFVTNEHAVRNIPQGKSVKLVLDAALDSQRVIDARVIRSDADQDLALLRIEGVKNLSVLPIGNSDGLAELTELIAFGFPFGTVLSLSKQEYPSISVNVCTLSALRRKGGKLDRIELNGALNPGQSGGPILDAEGKVVGVIVSGIRGSGIAQAIPASHLSRFLQRPEISFTPPRIDAAALNKPVIFSARLDSPIPSEKAPEVELILTGDGPPRRQKMELRDGIYKASLVPAPQGDKPRALELTARFPGGTVIVSPVADRELKIGGKTVHLRELKEIDRTRLMEPNAKVTRTDRSHVFGPVEGLKGIEVSIAGQPVTLDLIKAEMVTIAQAGTLTRYGIEIVATVGGKEVGRATAVLPVGDANQSAKPPVGTLPSANLDSEKLVRKLPAAFSEVVVGGNGRYLVFLLPQQRKLAVFDVPATRVAGFIPVDDDDVKFAAGIDKLVVGLPSKGLLQRWDLATLKRELTVQATTGTIKHVVMGHASIGPVLVHSINTSGGSAKTEFFDLESMKPIDLRDEKGRRDVNVETDGHVRASADGQTFGFWRLHTSPQGVSTLVIQGNSIRRYYDHYSAGHLLPGPDGKVIYSGRGRFTYECKAIDDPHNGYNYSNYMLPAVQGNYYLGIGQQAGDKLPINVFLTTDKRPLARLTIADGLPPATSWGREAVDLDKRLLFVPEARVIVVLPKTNDEVVLHRFDVDDALEKSGVDYLIVTSAAPSTAKRGAEFRYRITARAKKGGVTYKLESGPSGMRVSPDGMVTWDVPAGLEQKDANVIVTVRDAAGQETFHTFRLKVD